MKTGPRPVKGEPSRRAVLRCMPRLLEVSRVDLFEAGLQVSQTRQRTAGRHDALRNCGAHVAVSDDPPGASPTFLRTLRHDLLHALDAAQRACDIDARGFDQN